MKTVCATRAPIPILMYHSISGEASTGFRKFAVRPERFAEHLAYLAAAGYTPITVSQLSDTLARAGHDLPHRPIVLTFDDAFADFHSRALPVLQRHGFVATLYVPTAYVERTSRWLHREGETGRPLLTWRQVADVWASGIECGGHTHTHPQLDRLQINKARDEIVTCKRVLEDHLSQPVRTFAYPFGYHTPVMQEVVREAGYTSACAVGYRMSSVRQNPFALPRLLITADTQVRDLAALLAGDFFARATTQQAYQRIRSHIWRSFRRYTAPMAYRTQSQRAKRVTD